MKVSVVNLGCKVNRVDPTLSPKPMKAGVLNYARCLMRILLSSTPAR